MSPASSSPPLERATTAVIESERTKYPMQRFVARRFAQAALDACEFEAMQELLRRLVELKDHKEKAGKTLWYDREQPKAWEDARALLARLDTRP